MEQIHAGIMVDFQKALYRTAIRFFSSEQYKYIKAFINGRDWVVIVVASDPFKCSIMGFRFFVQTKKIIRKCFLFKKWCIWKCALFTMTLLFGDTISLNNAVMLGSATFATLVTSSGKSSGLSIIMA